MNGLGLLKSIDAITDLRRYYDASGQSLVRRSIGIVKSVSISAGLFPKGGGGASIESYSGWGSHTGLCFRR